MGFLGSVGKALGGFVRQVAPKVIQAVAPAATKLLKGVVGDLFAKGGGALQKLVGSALPGPLGSLASKLLGKALPKLQELAQGGIEKLIGKLADSITSRFAPGAGNVNLPSLPDRIQDMIRNMPQFPTAPTAPTAPSAPSAPTAPTTGTNSGAATGGVNTSNPVQGGDNLPPAPLTGRDAEDIGKQNEFNAKMQSYQARLSAMNKYWEMISTIYKAHDQTKSAIISNMR